MLPHLTPTPTMYAAEGITGKAYSTHSSKRHHQLTPSLYCLCRHTIAGLPAAACITRRILSWLPQTRWSSPVCTYSTCTVSCDHPSGLMKSEDWPICRGLSRQVVLRPMLLRPTCSARWVQLSRAGFRSNLAQLGGLQRTATHKIVAFLQKHPTLIPCHLRSFLCPGGSVSEHRGTANESAAEGTARGL